MAQTFIPVVIKSPLPSPAALAGKEDTIKDYDASYDSDSAAPDDVRVGEMYRVPRENGVAQVAIGTDPGDIPTVADTDARYAPIAIATPVVDQVSAWGDSLTASQGGTTPWPALLGVDLAVSVYNGGVSGQASSDIAIRQGGLQPLLTVTNNQIPASGPVTVTALSPVTSYRMDGTGSFSFSGTLAGIPGTLTHDMTGGTWSFTRTTSGSVVSCPAATPFICTDGLVHKSDIQVLWVGRNNLTNNGPVLTDAVRDLDEMVRYLTVGNSKYLVISITNNSSEIRSSTNYNAIIALNAILSSRFRERYVDLRTYLISSGLQIAGITPTNQDLADINNDVIPSSLRSDTTHLNDAGYGVVYKVVREKIRTLGWLVGQLPLAVPSTPTTPVLGTATQTTQPISWAAVSGATSYQVLARQTGTSGAWLAVGNTTGTSLTASGLTPGLSYDYRLYAWNIAGASASYSTVTGSTASTPPTILLSDSFNRSDTANLQSSNADNVNGGSGTYAWTTTSGIGITSNKAARTGSTGTRFAYLNAGVTDGRVRVTIGALTDLINLIGRLTDTNNYYRCNIDANGNIYITKVISGSTTVLTAGGLAGLVQTGDIIDFSIVGTALTVFRNGSQILSVTDSSITTGTNWGFQQGVTVGTSIDDFYVLNK